MGIYLSVFFVFKKAGKRLKIERKKFMNYGIKPVLGVSVLVNSALIVYLETKLLEPNVIDQVAACTSPIWIISSVFDFLSVIILMGFVVKFDDITAK